MKKATLFLAVLLILGTVLATAQVFDGKKFEAGASLDFYTISEKGYSTFGSYVYLPLRFGWFVWKGLEVEPEFALNIPLKYRSYYDIGYLATVNVFYNFQLGKRFLPFVGGGFSIGNSLPYSHPYGQMWSEGSPHTSAYNLGGGLKYLLSDHFLVRAEYRFSHFRYHFAGENVYFYPVNRAFIGVSYLF